MFLWLADKMMGLDTAALERADRPQYVAPKHAALTAADYRVLNELMAAVKDLRSKYDNIVIENAALKAEVARLSTPAPVEFK